MIETKAEIILVSFNEGRLLDARLVRQTGKELQAAVSQSTHKKLLLNFRGVLYMASTMISELIKLYNACNAADVDLKFCNVPPHIMEVFRITKLHKIIEIKATEDAAVTSFGKKRFLADGNRGENRDASSKG